MVNKSLLLLSILISCLPQALHAQAWSGIIAPSRAISWSGAGAVGGNPQTGALPDASWPLCTSAQAGTTVPIPAYGTSGSPASPSTINKALTACASANPSGSVVVLASGSFYLNAGIDFTGLNYVALRGQGANSTLLTFSGYANCGGYSAFVCVAPATNVPETEANVCNVAPSSNLSQGSTTITLQNCGSTTPAAGSINNLKVGAALVIDQVDLAADNGLNWATTCGPESTYETCRYQPEQEQNGGNNRTDGPTVNGIADRSMEQTVVVTAVSASTGVISFSPGLYLNSWTSAQLPQVFYPTITPTNVGIENVFIQPPPEPQARSQVSMSRLPIVTVAGSVVSSLYTPLALTSKWIGAPISRCRKITSMGV